MKKILFMTSCVILLAFPGFAQEMNSKGMPTASNDQNAPVELKAGDKITRGALLAANVKRASVEKAYSQPDKVAGKTVEVKGVIVRSCKMEGCWMEMADKEGGRSVRVTFGDHAFYIPLNSAGLAVRAQGTFKTSVLPKEKVEHLIKDDGAKFEKINPDGTVTELSFDATGVELVKTK